MNNATRACNNCGDKLVSRHPAAKYCNKRECQYAAKQARKRTATRCRMDSCYKPVESLGLCHVHYKANRRKTKQVYVGDCGWCGEQVYRGEARDYPRVFCNVDHLNKWSGDQRRKVYTTDLVKWVKPKRKAPALVHARGHLTWMQGQCCICGSLFIHWQSSSITCSNECAAENKRRVRKNRAARRRAREREAFVSDVHLHLLIEEHGDSCHLCGLPIDLDKQVPHPQSATIDHVVPLARGGKHEPANCRPAHFRCNSFKRDEVTALTYEWDAA